MPGGVFDIPDQVVSSRYVCSTSSAAESYKKTYYTSALAGVDSFIADEQGMDPGFWDHEDIESMMRTCQIVLKYTKRADRRTAMLSRFNQAQSFIDNNYEDFDLGDH